MDSTLVLLLTSARNLAVVIWSDNQEGSVLVFLLGLQLMGLQIGSALALLTSAINLAVVLWSYSYEGLVLVVLLGQLIEL